METRLGTLDDWLDGGVITDIAADYAEQGYSKDGEGPIVLGNWNSISTYNAETGKRDIIDSRPERLGEVLERCGYTLEWLDEWVVCTECNEIFRSQPDSYCWTMFGTFFDDCEPVCGNCVRGELASEYIDGIMNDASKCNTLLDADAFTDLGYVKFNGTYANGFHPGQDDVPAEIARNLPTGICNFIFDIRNGGDVSQFYIEFILWVEYYEQD